MISEGLPTPFITEDTKEWTGFIDAITFNSALADEIPVVRIVVARRATLAVRIFFSNVQIIIDDVSCYVIT